MIKLEKLQSLMNQATQDFISEGERRKLKVFLNTKHPDKRKSKYIIEREPHILDTILPDDSESDVEDLPEYLIQLISVR